MPEEPQGKPYLLRLYVSGRAGSSRHASAAVRRICDVALGNSAYRLDVIDVWRDPDRAEGDKVLATPTLIRQAPPPERRLVGDFSDAEKVLAALRIGNAKAVIGSTVGSHQ